MLPPAPPCRGRGPCVPKGRTAVHGGVRSCGGRQSSASQRRKRTEAESCTQQDPQRRAQRHAFVQSPGSRRCVGLLRIHKRTDPPLEIPRTLAGSSSVGVPSFSCPAQQVSEASVGRQCCTQPVPGTHPSILHIPVYPHLLLPPSDLEHRYHHS